VDTIGPGGTTEGDVWSFTTIIEAPGQASSPSPASAGANIAVDAALSWTNGARTATVDVYFGTDQNNLTKVVDNENVAAYTPAADLEYETTYYWRVDCTNANGTTTGTAWSFTTAGEIDVALYTVLTSDAAVSALVGTRVYPNIVPQNKAMPAITYQQISGLRNYTMDGPVGLVEARFQINCWSTTYVQSRVLARLVRKALDNYSTTPIEITYLENEGDMPEVESGKDVLRRYGKRLDFTVWFKETI